MIYICDGCFLRLRSFPRDAPLTSSLKSRSLSFLSGREGLQPSSVRQHICIAFDIPMRFDDSMDRDPAMGGGGSANSSSDFVSL